MLFKYVDYNEHVTDAGIRWQLPSTVLWLTNTRFLMGRLRVGMEYA